MEIWVVADFNSLYSISSLGRVKNNKRGQILKTHVDNRGYVRVGLRTGLGGSYCYSIHRLVAQNFLKSSYVDGFVVDHLDGNKQNNNVENLEWVTPQENIIRAHKMGLANGKPCENNSMASINNETARKIKYSFDLSNAEASRQLAVSLSVVEKIRARERWTEIIDRELEEQYQAGTLQYTREKGATLTKDVSDAVYEEILKGDLKPLEIAKKFGIHKATVYKKIKKMNKND